MSEQFDDEKLQNLARYSFYSNSTGMETTTTSKVKKLISQEKLDNSERNFLLQFIDSNKINKPKSMREMRDEIMSMIGKSSSSSGYVNTFSRQDIELVYNWFRENFKRKA